MNSLLIEAKELDRNMARRTREEIESSWSASRELGARLRAARKKAGKPLKDVSRSIGIGVSTICQWEVGTAVIPEYRRQTILTYVQSLEAVSKAQNVAPVRQPSLSPDSRNSEPNGNALLRVQLRQANAVAMILRFRLVSPELISQRAADAILACLTDIREGTY